MEVALQNFVLFLYILFMHLLDSEQGAIRVVLCDAASFSFVDSQKKKSLHCQSKF